MSYWCIHKIDASMPLCWVDHSAWANTAWSYLYKTLEIQSYCEVTEGSSVISRTLNQSTGVGVGGQVQQHKGTWEVSSLWSGVLSPLVYARVRTHHSTYLRYLQTIVSIKSQYRCKECLEETRTVEETKWVSALKLSSTLHRKGDHGPKMVLASQQLVTRQGISILSFSLDLLKSA